MTESSGRSHPEGSSRSEPGGARDFLKYTFYKLRPEWRFLPGEERKGQKAELAELLRREAEAMTLRCYSLVGIRADADLMLWTIHGRLEAFRDQARRIASTGLGRYLDTAYAYLAAGRPSAYLGGHEHEGQEGTSGRRVPAGSRYLFVYPFTKKREWYSIPFDDRQRMMREHVRIGHRFPSVKIHTGYSFGLDDQEFMLGFETDNPLDFLDLVMELRSSDASKYTERETPLFTCVLSSPESALDALGD